MVSTLVFILFIFTVEQGRCRSSCSDRKT